MKHKKIKRILSNTQRKSALYLIIIFFIFTVVMSVGYLSLSWAKYNKSLTTEAIKVAETFESLLPSHHIWKIIDNNNNEGMEYNLIRNRLEHLAKNSDYLHYAYLLGIVEDELVILVEPGSEFVSDCSGAEILNELLFDDTWISSFEDGELFFKTLHKHKGNCIQTLIPVKDSQKNIIAFLGLVYSAEEWKVNLWQSMIPNILFVCAFFILFIAFSSTLLLYIRLRRKSQKLILYEELYRTLFEQAPIGVALNDYESHKLNSKFISINPMGEKILGRDLKTLRTIPWQEMTHEDDLKNEVELFKRFVNKEIDGYSFEKRLLKPDGSIIWSNIKVSSFINTKESDLIYLCLFEDITSRKNTEEELSESERSKDVLLSHLPGIVYRCLYDEEWTMKFISNGFKKITGYEPDSVLNNHELSFREIVSPEYRELLLNETARALSQGKDFRYEYEIITKDGTRKWVLDIGQGLLDKDGNPSTLEGVIFDISKQKKREAEIKYLSNHDFLTGLYNRNYLSKEKVRLSKDENMPLSVIVCDINGLRLINDAYSYTQGDHLIMETANLLQILCRNNDVIGRTAGGEFMMLLPRTSHDEVQEIVEEISITIESFNRSNKQPLYDISISIGYSTIENVSENIDTAIKIAQNYMTNRKLLNQKSMHHSILSSFMSTLYAKSQETEEHGKRLGEYTTMVGEHLNFPLKALDDLRLLSMLHDIGKIGIADSILSKPDKLNADEWEQMKTHPQIGYRIAMATPELEHIAKFILHHHERWDGTGYPKGIKGTEIPLLSRILAVADAYDAMTIDRVYQKAISSEEALEEIERGAGTQFDPYISEVFCKIINNKLHSDCSIL